MHVAEVHFNHDPLNMSSDAMTIRQNYAGPRIEAPEWTNDSTGRPIAYASAAIAGDVTIKVRFGGGPPGESVRIRAVDADVTPDEPGCLGLILLFFLGLIKALAGNVLGDVAEKTIPFDSLGNSPLETMTLSGHHLSTSAVGIRATGWKWQRRSEKTWTTFDRTEHKVYVVLDTPRPPWSQQLLPDVVAAAGVGPELPEFYLDNTQLPWVDALEVACTWALGATTKAQAAAEIVRAVNSETPQVYNTITHFGGSSFLLTSYLDRLAAGAPFQTNCTDCANAVTTLSNLLGCDLVEQYLSTSVVPTKPFLTLNGNALDPSDWVQYMWIYHEFGWTGPANDTGFVHDGCLQVDLDDDPDDDVHVAHHPIHMPFPSYRPRLWDDPGGLDTVQRRRALL